MSIRTALTWTLLGISLLGTAAISILGAQRIRREVEAVAQAQVDQDLHVVEAAYTRRLDAFADRFRTEVEAPVLDDPELATRLTALTEQLDLSVLAVVAADGRRLAGPHPEDAKPLDLTTDPVLRQALAGRPSWGTVRLDRDRLWAEGGDALVASATLRSGTDTEEDALAWWVGVPVRNDEGRVQAVVYGGRILNHDHPLVDGLSALTHEDTRYDGKPQGTVTLFLGPVRVATNVIGSDGRRALGTRVSDEVAARVLQHGGRWNGRANVVDAWYLSGYAPITDPDQSVVGMIYVGHLETPFADAQRRQLYEFLSLVGLIGLLAVGATFWLVRRITKPLASLGASAEAFGRGEWEQELERPRTYTELRGLRDTMEEMRAAIVERDARLAKRRAELAEANEALQRVNRNYMETLGFVTHELKAPLAAIQMQSRILTDQFAAEVPDAGKRLLVRIQRNCEELQGMVKDYLDLSRAERGELEVSPADIELRGDVIDASVTQSAPLLKSRSMELEVNAPETLPMRADAELLRIALTNLLSNAAKYGAADGVVRINVSSEAESVAIAVQNDGVGFSAEDGKTLFKRFTRLKNKNTRDKRGSGLGLFLVRKIAEQHGGTAVAESEPGEWARFTIHIPTKG